MYVNKTTNNNNNQQQQTNQNNNMQVDKKKKKKERGLSEYNFTRKVEVVKEKLPHQCKRQNI